MARVAALCVVVLAGLVAPARADVGMLPNSGVLVFEDLYIHEDGDVDFTVPSEPLEQDRYFNLAHCVCSEAGAGLEQEFQLSMQITGATGPINRPAEIWSGPECENDVTRDTNCVRIDEAGIADLSQLQNMIQRRTFDVFDLVAPRAVACPASEATGTLWVRSDTDGDNTYDYYASVGIEYDTQPPPVPANATTSAGENAIQVNWDAATDRAEDVAYYQALCSRVDTGAPAKSPPSHEPRYETTTQLCPTALSHEVTLSPVANKRDQGEHAFGPPDGPTPDAAPVDAAGPDAMPTGLPEAMEDLDASFVCGEETAPASGMRITGLENGAAYRVAILAVDLVGNTAGIYFQNPVTPLPVTDLWEDLHDQGSEVEGGFCLVAETYGGDSGLTNTLRRFRDDTLASTALGRWLTAIYNDVSDALGSAVHDSLALRVIAGIALAPLVAVALLWHALTLPGLLLLVAGLWLWRKRRRTGARRLPRRALAAALVVGLVAIGSAASAQPSSDPYWSEPNFEEDVGEELLDPHWHVGIRVGPYTPAIDDQLGGTEPGPYEQMFGDGASIMPVLDVDWLFLRRFGQLGVGGSIGALWKSAKAYEAGSDPNDPMRPRSEGDISNFRLVPLAATVVYRFTYLDDAYGIPVVPYVRGGLSYYIWWMGAPSGNTAVIRTPAGCDRDAEGCEENRARGGTIGFQGSIGLAIRAERIDAGAARSMQQGGVEHAGFYAELSLAKVDGFGNDKKLSVGDATWFAGVDFEF